MHAPKLDQLQSMLEGDFDPDKFDAAMAAAFDVGYYDDANDDDENDILQDDTAEAEARKVPDAPDSFASKHKDLLQRSCELDKEFGYVGEQKMKAPGGTSKGGDAPSAPSK